MHTSRSTHSAHATSSGVRGRVTHRSRASSRPARIVARDASETTSPTGMIAVVATGIVLTASPVWAFDGDAAGAFSSRGCVGCHAAGGNVVSASATLFSQDLGRMVREIDNVRHVVDVSLFPVSAERLDGPPGWETQQGHASLALEGHDLFAVRHVRVAWRDGAS